MARYRIRVEFSRTVDDGIFQMAEEKLKSFFTNAYEIKGSIIYPPQTSTQKREIEVTYELPQHPEECGHLSSLHDHLQNIKGLCGGYKIFSVDLGRQDSKEDEFFPGFEMEQLHRLRCEKEDWGQLATDADKRAAAAEKIADEERKKAEEAHTEAEKFKDRYQSEAEAKQAVEARARDLSIENTEFRTERQISNGTIKTLGDEKVSLSRSVEDKQRACDEALKQKDEGYRAELATQEQRHSRAIEQFQSQLKKKDGKIGEIKGAARKAEREKTAAEGREADLKKSLDDVIPKFVKLRAAGPSPDLQMRLDDAEKEVVEKTELLERQIAANADLATDLVNSRVMETSYAILMGDMRRDPSWLVKSYLGAYSEFTYILYKVMDELMESETFGSDRLPDAISVAGMTFADYVKRSIDVGELAADLQDDDAVERLIAQAQNIEISPEFVESRSKATEAEKRLRHISRYEDAVGRGKDPVVECGDFANDTYTLFKAKESELIAEVDLFEGKKQRAAAMKIVAAKATELKEQYRNMRLVIENAKKKISEYAAENNLDENNLCMPYFVKFDDTGDSFTLEVRAPVNSDSKEGTIRKMIEQHVTEPFVEFNLSSDKKVELPETKLLKTTERTAADGTTMYTIFKSPSSVVRRIVFKKEDFNRQEALDLTDLAIKKWFENKDRYDIYTLGIKLGVIKLDSMVG